MIPNQWYAVLESRDLPSGKPMGVKRLAQSLVLWRTAEGEVVCMKNRCAHRGTALEIGSLARDRIVCAYHGFQYDKAGRCVRMPCAGAASIPSGLKVKTFPVREANGFIFVWWGEARESYPEIPWIEGFPTDPRTTLTRSEIWPFNYARLVENNLDAHHWAFLHGSIMVGIGERVDDFEVTTRGNGIDARGTLRHAKSPAGAKGWDFRLAFQAPNVNLIKVTPRYQSLTMTTPVDEYTSWVAIRLYQTYVRVPVLRQMLDYYCNQFLFAVPQYRQDFPVFHTQTPRLTDLGTATPVQADRALAAYLKMRRRLIDEAKAAQGPTVERASSRPRAEGYWNDSLNGHRGDASLAWADGKDRGRVHAEMAYPLPSLLPERERNVTKGRERGLGKAALWTKNCLSFPLLVPSLVLSTVLDRWDRLRG